MSAFFRLERMLVTRGSHILYDEAFHEGVNIIHGPNASGKSTIADFIFFGLGGDVKKWNASASRAEFVYLQLITAAGILSLRRELSTDGRRPMSIYFGTLDDALSSPEEGWQTFPYQRQEHGYSFNQVLFEAIGLPEVISSGTSNITMHQLLRLLYIDQQTPVQRIFRVEDFDLWETRQAIGGLLAGIGGYDFFRKQIELRGVEKAYATAVTEYKNLVKVASGYGENILSEHINAAINKATQGRDSLLISINKLISATEQDNLFKDLDHIHRELIIEYNTAKNDVFIITENIKSLEYEISDSENFINHISQSILDFDDSSNTFLALGHLTFNYCPSCFSQIQAKDAQHCQLCNNKRTDGEDDSRTLAVHLDLQMQLKESEILQKERKGELSKKKSKLRLANQRLKSASSAIKINQSETITGRENAIAELSRKLGFIDSQLETLHKCLDLANKIQAVSNEKDILNTRITSLKNEISAITHTQEKRKSKAYTLISNQTKEILKKDLQDHSDLGEVDNVTFDFSGDWIAINGEKNRAGSASGMVILKNSFAAGMLSASMIDKEFNLPRWMLFDNIEDKGMVEERSWNFQRLLVSLSKKAKMPHQIIYTTSKIAPELDQKNLVVGNKYSNENRSLK